MSVETVVAIVLGVILTLAVIWIGLVVFALVKRPAGLRASAVAWLLPDLLRLVSRLARDQTIPRRYRLELWGLLAFMASPIDLIPDVIPVIGQADDVVLAYLVLRSVARGVGSDVLAEHWPGTPEGLEVLKRFLRI